MTDTDTLKLIQMFTEDMNKSNKTSAKKAVMSVYTMLKPIFKLAWDSNLKYNVSPASLKNRATVIADGAEYTEHRKYVKLIDLLKYLTASNTTASNKTRDAVLYYIKNNKKYEELIYLIMDKKKKLKVRMGEKTVHEVFPNLFQVFNVALGRSFKNDRVLSCFNKSIENNDTWFMSRKYDGVRAIIECDIDSKKIKVRSRHGKLVNSVKSLEEYVTTYIIPGFIAHQKQKNEVKDDDGKTFVLDGEIIIWDSSDEHKNTENFKTTVSQFRRKAQMDNPHYKIFDMLTSTEFNSGISAVTRTLSDRMKELTSVLAFTNELVQIHNKSEMISIVHQYKYTPEKFSKMKDKYVLEAWEGLILRKDTPYKGKKSNDIIKVKKGESVELKVIRLATGTQPTLRKDGTMQDENVLAAAIVKHKHMEVSVGTGFSLDDKRKYYKNPELLLDKTICINYMEETEDGSLRHPVFHGIVGDEKRDT